MEYKLLEFNIKGDDRGSLVALEELREVPFEIKRVYYIFDTKAEVSRGYHAHKDLNQLLICLSGSFDLSIDNGEKKVKVRLEKRNQGVVLGSMIWREMSNFSDDCVVMVLADRIYDPQDYIKDYNKFIQLVKGDKSGNEGL